MTDQAAAVVKLLVVITHASEFNCPLTTALTVPSAVQGQREIGKVTTQCANRVGRSKGMHVFVPAGNGALCKHQHATIHHKGKTNKGNILHNVYFNRIIQLTLVSVVVAGPNIGSDKLLDKEVRRAKHTKL